MLGDDEHQDDLALASVFRRYFGSAGAKSRPRIKICGMASHCIAQLTAFFYYIMPVVGLSCMKLLQVFFELGKAACRGRPGRRPVFHGAIDGWILSLYYDQFLLVLVLNLACVQSCSVSTPSSLLLPGPVSLPVPPPLPSRLFAFRHAADFASFVFLPAVCFIAVTASTIAVVTLRISTSIFFALVDACIEKISLQHTTKSTHGKLGVELTSMGLFASLGLVDGDCIRLMTAHPAPSHHGLTFRPSKSTVSSRSCCIHFADSPQYPH